MPIKINGYYYCDGIIIASQWMNGMIHYTYMSHSLHRQQDNCQLPQNALDSPDIVHSP